jgi:carboxyl-terminal processing protease
VEETPAKAATSERFDIKPSMKLLGKILLVIFLITGIFVSGYGYGLYSAELSGPSYPKVVNLVRNNPDGKEELDFGMFWRVWDTLHTAYFDTSKVQDSQLVYGAIKGMVAAVGDPYTVFLTPDENKVSTEDLQGNFEGVGIQIGFRGSRLAVIAPLPGTPAAEAGIKAGDYIVGITDKDKNVERGTSGISLPDAVQLIRGPAGSIVTLTIVRDGDEDPVVADVVRRSIDVPSILLTHEGENEDIARISVLRFGEETLSEWDEAVVAVLQKPENKGLIVDLRNNPGGYLNRAVDLAAEFMDTGELVTIEEWGNGKRQEFRTERIGRLKNIKLVVLVNGGSASASEILAGALRDNNDTTIIGEKSFGKGTIQEAQQLESGTGLHLTIAKWLTPNEVWVNDQGLVPDIEVVDDPETPDDEQLVEAMNYISGNSQSAGVN